MISRVSHTCSTVNQYLYVVPDFPCIVQVLNPSSAIILSNLMTLRTADESNLMRAGTGLLLAPPSPFDGVKGTMGSSSLEGGSSSFDGRSFDTGDVKITN